MIKLKFVTIVSLLFIFLFSILWNCTYKGNAIGEPDHIYVFADSTDWRVYEDILSSIFEQYIRTPAMESEFIIQHVPFDKFEKYRDYKNLFLLGRLNSGLPVSSAVRELLNQDIIDGVREGKYFYIPKEEAWAENQYVLFLVAESQNDMIQKISDLGDLIYRDFRNYYYQRMKERMFRQMEQKDLEKYIADHYPFTIRIQHDYFIADENKEENYVWIRRYQKGRRLIDRSILVHWLPVPEDFQLTSRWVIDERNRLAETLFEGDVVVEEETRAFEVQFKQWNAVHLKGTWRNDSLMIGGPFRNYTFVDQNTDRIYFLDYYVQAIGRRKKPYLDQLYVIVHTFDTLQKPRTSD